MNGEVCCVLGVCCPAGSEAQAQALATELAKDGVCEEREALKIAKWTLKHFDLAPAGSLTELKGAIASLVRKKHGIVE